MLLLLATTYPRLKAAKTSLRSSENATQELAATLEGMKNLRSCFFADSGGATSCVSPHRSAHAKPQLALARLVCATVGAWLMFLSEQKFRSIFCSPGPIDNARIGFIKRFLFW